jgi:hypothetical protein
MRSPTKGATTSPATRRTSAARRRRWSSAMRPTPSPGKSATRSRTMPK